MGQMAEHCFFFFPKKQLEFDNQVLAEYDKIIVLFSKSRLAREESEKRVTF